MIDLLQNNLTGAGRRRNSMSKIIDAIFEDGVFKPVQTVEVKEHEKASFKIISVDEWQSRFNRIIEKIQKKSVRYTSQEIESDISQAITEIREDKRGH
jgi:predicted DNA-binding antitoxin AbrB/MazE fold protein